MLGPFRCPSISSVAWAAKVLEDLELEDIQNLSLWNLEGFGGYFQIKWIRDRVWWIDWFGLLFQIDLKYCKAMIRLLNQRPVRITPNDDILASSSIFP